MAKNWLSLLMDSFANRHTSLRTTPVHLFNNIPVNFGSLASEWRREFFNPPVTSGGTSACNLIFTGSHLRWDILSRTEDLPLSLAFMGRQRIKFPLSLSQTPASWIFAFSPLCSILESPPAVCGKQGSGTSAWERRPAGKECWGSSWILFCLGPLETKVTLPATTLFLPTWFVFIWAQSSSYVPFKGCIAKRVIAAPHLPKHWSLISFVNQTCFGSILQTDVHARCGCVPCNMWS